jgi:hypothetical protein
MARLGRSFPAKPFIRRVVAGGSSGNLLPYSEQFDNAAWGLDRASILADVIRAPDHTLTADKIVENTANGQHDVYQYFTGAADNETRTFSCYLKAAERTFTEVDVGPKDGNNYYVFVNLSTGVITEVGVSTLVSSISDAGNGWWRVSITGSMGSGASSTYVDLSPTTGGSGGTQIYTGDGVSGLYLWGAQLEIGSLSAYQPTPVHTLKTVSGLAAASLKTMTGLVKANVKTYLELRP